MIKSIKKLIKWSYDEKAKAADNPLIAISYVAIIVIGWIVGAIIFYAEFIKK